MRLAKLSFVLFTVLMPIAAQAGYCESEVYDQFLDPNDVEAFQLPENSSGKNQWMLLAENKPVFKRACGDECYKVLSPIESGIRIARHDRKKVHIRVERAMISINGSACVPDQDSQRSSAHIWQTNDILPIVQNASVESLTR